MSPHSPQHCWNVVSHPNNVFCAAGPESYLGIHAAFSCSLQGPQSWTVTIFLFFVSLSVFSTKPYCLGYPAVSSWPDSGLAFSVPFSVRHTEGAPRLDMLTLITWSCQHLLGFSTFNSPFFPWPLIILWEAFWGYVHILFFIKPPLITPTFVCHHYDCQVTVSHFPFFLIGWHSTVKKKELPFFTHLFIPVFISGN